MASIPALFVIAAVATGSGVKVLAQGHSRAYEPQGTNDSGNGLGNYLDLDPPLHSVAVPNSEEGRLRSAKYDNQGLLTNESEGNTTLHRNNPEGSGGDPVRRHVTLVIAVPSARPDRRKAIRETWMKLADDRVVLRFFTEPPNQTSGGKHAQGTTTTLTEESQTHGDVVIQDIDSGMNFGLKLLWAMRWMSYHYSFDYFLRLDDDYFLCLDRLLHELECLLRPGTKQSPIFAGYRVCAKRREGVYVDEAYILISSSIVTRVLASSNLMCSGFGSLTAAAWVRVGGPGNPEGDIAFVHDSRVDQTGNWWKEKKQEQAIRSLGPVCERNIGIHHTYPERMLKLWMEVSGRANVSWSTGGCTSLYRYEDDGECPFVSNAVSDAYLTEDNGQPCESFVPIRKKIWCGHQGC